jgi:DNA-binding NtrC family response regulator
MPPSLPDTDDTLTQPLWSAAWPGAPLLGMTVLWHPDFSRVGEQWLGLAAPGEQAVSRYAPVFAAAGATAALPLGHRTVSREPLLLCRDSGGNVTIRPPVARMRIELDGMPLTDAFTIGSDRLADGVVLSLGGAVLLCLHWMPALPRWQPPHGIVGVGAAAQRLRAQVGQAAATTLPVLLLGETGAGKEVAARAIHAAGALRNGPLVAVNMATLHESLAASELFGASKGAYTGAQHERGGLFAAAAGGTLFLDEIGATPPAVQPMLLRVLESGEYRPVGSARTHQSQARIVAATDAQLENSPGFIQPLLRRLEGYVIHVPPLRRRREDLGVLLVHFAGDYLARHGGGSLPPEWVALLCLAPWPGNVRQFASVVRRVLLALEQGEPLPPELLAALARPPGPEPERQGAIGAPAAAAHAIPDTRAPLRTDLAGVSDEAVLDALRQGGWRILRAAQLLGVSRPSMYKLVARNRYVRAPETIPRSEIVQALRENGGDMMRCAAALQTPGEALRRHVRAHGLMAAQPSYSDGWPPSPTSLSGSNT